MDSKLIPLAITIKNAIQSALDLSQKEYYKNPISDYKKILALKVSNHLKQANFKMPMILKSCGLSNFFKDSAFYNVNVDIKELPMPAETSIANLYKVIFSLNTVSNVTPDILNYYQNGQKIKIKLNKVDTSNNFPPGVNSSGGILTSTLNFEKELRNANIYYGADCGSTALSIVEKKFSNQRFLYKPVIVGQIFKMGESSSNIKTAKELILKGMGAGFPIFGPRKEDYTISCKLDLNMSCIATSNPKSKIVGTCFSTKGEFGIVSEKTVNTRYSDIGDGRPAGAFYKSL